MKVKPKEVLANLPIVLTFTHEGEDAALASGFNTFLHGKVRLKYESLGKLNDQYVSIFYLQRNGEYNSLREQFVNIIEQEELTLAGNTPDYDPKFGDNKLCECGHTYERHFDTYADMEPIGCKHCNHYTECTGFKLTLNLQSLV